MDRVIHNRGQVASESREKIQKIIDELNYQPNILARSLASKRTYTFATLLPEHNRDTGEYWNGPLAGIKKAWDEITDYNIILKDFQFAQFDENSFRTKIEEMLQISPDAVLVSPVFKAETQRLSNKLDELSIPYIFIDSTLEGLNNLAYFGQNSFQSGFLAAKLLQNGLSENSEIAVIVPNKSNILNQDNSRIQGFNAYFEKNNLQTKYKFQTVVLNSNTDCKNDEQLISFFTENKNIAAAVVFNSRVFEIASVLEILKLKGIKLLGYDLIAENIKFLQKGTVSYLLAQRPEEQGYRAIMSFFNFLFLKKEICKDNYMPIDILTAENIDYYINFNK